MIIKIRKTIIEIYGINLWRYWKKTFRSRDLCLISIDLHDSLSKGSRFVLLNIGISIQFYKEKDIWKRTVEANKPVRNND